MLDLPVMVGLSRKATIYKTLDIKPEDSLKRNHGNAYAGPGTGCAQILRVHDVKEAVETIRLWTSYASVHRTSPEQIIFYVQVREQDACLVCSEGTRHHGHLIFCRCIRHIHDFHIENEIFIWLFARTRLLIIGEKCRNIKRCCRSLSLKDEHHLPIPE